MQVHRPLRDVVVDLRHRHLHRGDVPAHLLVVLVAVDQPRGAQHQQPELLDLDPAVGDLLLHHLQRRELAAAHLARQRALAHHVEGLAKLRDGAHRVVDAAAAEARLGDHEGRAGLAEHVVGRHAHVLVAHVGVARVLGALGADADVAHDAHAGRLARHDDHAHALVGRDVGVGHRHHDQERRVAGVRGEPLLAVDQPVVAVEPRARREERRVGAGVGLGHRVTGRDLAVEQRLEVALLLRRAAVVREDLGVAGVGGLAAEHRRCPARAAEDLVHQRELELAEAGASELGAQVARPQAALLHALLQRLQDRHRARVALVVGAAEHVVERLDLVSHERVQPVELALELGLGLEVPGHRGVLRRGRAHGTPAGGRGQSRRQRPRCCSRSSRRRWWT